MSASVQTEILNMDWHLSYGVRVMAASRFDHRDRSTDCSSAGKASSDSDLRRLTRSGSCCQLRSSLNSRWSTRGVPVSSWIESMPGGRRQVVGQQLNQLASEGLVVR